MDTIEFRFEGSVYSVASAIDKVGYARLPDGRTVKVLSWLETVPRQVSDLSVVATGPGSAPVAVLVEEGDSEKDTFSMRLNTADRETVARLRRLTGVQSRAEITRLAWTQLRRKLELEENAAAGGGS